MANLPEPDFAHTPEAKQRRLDKAERLAEFMTDHGVTATPTAGDRRFIERCAGLPRSSDETWTLALQIWGERRG